MTHGQIEVEGESAMMGGRLLVDLIRSVLSSIRSRRWMVPLFQIQIEQEWLRVRTGLGHDSWQLLVLLLPVSHRLGVAFLRMTTGSRRVNGSRWVNWTRVGPGGGALAR